MKFKKIHLLFLGILMVFILPTSAFAQDTPGQWDKLGTETITLTADGSYHTINLSKYWSYGGDYKVSISGLNSNDWFNMDVYDADPDGNDDYVYGTTYKGPDTDFKFSTAGYVDGSNNEAELYFRFYGTENDTIYVTFYD